jgi:hypothetical protein
MVNASFPLPTPCPFAAHRMMPLPSSLCPFAVYDGMLTSYPLSQQETSTRRPNRSCPFVFSATLSLIINSTKCESPQKNRGKRKSSASATPDPERTGSQEEPQEKRAKTTPAPEDAYRRELEKLRRAEGLKDQGSGHQSLVK